jgi:hypothetical protein
MSVKLIFDLGGLAVDWTPRDFIVDLCPSETASLHTESVRDAVLHAVVQHFEPYAAWALFIATRFRLSIWQSTSSSGFGQGSWGGQAHGSRLKALKLTESLPDCL